MNLKEDAQSTKPTEKVVQVGGHTSGKLPTFVAVVVPGPPITDNPGKLLTLGFGINQISQQFCCKGFSFVFYLLILSCHT